MSVMHRISDKTRSWRNVAEMPILDIEQLCGIAISLLFDRQSSAYVRAAHKLQGCLDVPPGFSLFALTVFLAVAGPPGGLNHCHVSMGFQQLSRVIVDFHFSDPHDAVLLFLLFRPTRLKDRVSGDQMS
jgi:hypothetical protein